MMNTEQNLKFKIASEEWEFEAIHSLNYKTFVEEIPQHQHSGEKRLVDKFHRENTYVICLEGERLVGRLDPKLHREQGLLEIRALWWEPGVRASQGRQAALEAAVERLARLTGASEWSLAPPAPAPVA